MATAFGVLCLIGAAFWLIVTLRALPGSTTHIGGGTLHNSWFHTGLGIVLTVVFLILGISLM